MFCFSGALVHERRPDHARLGEYSPTNRPCQTCLEVFGIRRYGMGIKVSVVGPRFDDAEVCEPSGLLEELDPLESVLFAAGIPVLLHSSDRGASGCRYDIDVGGRIGGTIRL